MQIAIGRRRPAKAFGIGVVVCGWCDRCRCTGCVRLYANPVCEISVSLEGLNPPEHAQRCVSGRILTSFTAYPLMKHSCVEVYAASPPSTV